MEESINVEEVIEELTGKENVKNFIINAEEALGGVSMSAWSDFYAAIHQLQYRNFLFLNWENVDNHLHEELRLWREKNACSPGKNASWFSLNTGKAAQRENMAVDIRKAIELTKELGASEHASGYFRDAAKFVGLSDENIAQANPDKRRKMYDTLSFVAFRNIEDAKIFQRDYLVEIPVVSFNEDLDSIKFSYLELPELPIVVPDKNLTIVKQDLF